MGVREMVVEKLKKKKEKFDVKNDSICRVSCKTISCMQKSS